MRSFDVIVVGGGIAGAGIALDASQRGLSVLLVDKSDFGGAASAGCFGILHGGVRYLQQLDFRRLFESAREQQILRQIAPNHFAALPIVFPCKGVGLKSNWVLSSAITFYEGIAAFRNCGVSDEVKLPGLKRIGREELLNQYPGLSKADPTSGVIYNDAQFVSTQRFLMSVLKTAVRSGATVLNYHRILKTGAIPLGGDDAPRWELQIENTASGATETVSGRWLINSTGQQVEPFYTEHLACHYGKQRMNPRRFVKAIQLVLPRIFDQGLAVQSNERDEGSVVSRGGRSFFLIPSGPHTLVGTYEEVTEPVSPFSITDEEIEDFLRSLITSYDFVEKPRVLSAWGGYIPLEWVRSDKNYSVARDDLIVEHHRGKGKGAAPRAISVAAVKYSTFRKTAERVVDKICEKRSVSRNVPLVGSEVDDLCTFRKRYRHQIDSLKSNVSDGYLYSAYGANLIELASLNKEQSSESFLELEARYFKRYEFARSADDVLKRRLPFSRSIGLNETDRAHIEKAFR